MFRWKKLGRIFNPIDFAGQGWMQEYAQAPSVVIFDNYVRIYFSSRALPDEDGMYISRLGYIDVNRHDLFEVMKVCENPILSLGNLGTFDEFGTYPASVIKTNESIRVYYAGWTRCVSVPINVAIGFAISNDHGDTFERIGDGPVLSYTPDEPFVLGSPKIRKFNDIWYLWYSSGRTWIPNNGNPHPMYKIRMAHSTDGFEWIRIGKNLINDVLEENECQASPDVFFYKGRFHMWFSYRYNLDFRRKNRGYRIGYAFSEDLINWIRNDNEAGIGISKDGWDSESVSYPFVFELDGKILMLYQGNEMGKYGFGLAELESNSH